MNYINYIIKYYKTEKAMKYVMMQSSLKKLYKLFNDK